LVAVQVVFILNFFGSMVLGRKAGNNPWNANSLEWVAPSPPPHGNFTAPLTVYRGPYEYSVPGRDKDFWLQTDPEVADGRNSH
jgi:cytochrome c oxidase subunit 1